MEHGPLLDARGLTVDPERRAALHAKVTIDAWVLRDLLAEVTPLNPTAVSTVSAFAALAADSPGLIEDLAPAIAMLDRPAQDELLHRVKESVRMLASDRRLVGAARRTAEGSRLSEPSGS